MVDRAARAIAVVAVAVVGGLFASGTSAARPRPEPCDAGHYFVEEGRVLVPTGPRVAQDMLAVGDTIAILSGCPPVASNARVTRYGTRINAVFPSCEGLRGKARLKARIGPHCRAMHGVFRAKTDKVHTRFSATRSTCGDGIFDADFEACDAGMGCTGGTCADCTCAAETTTTTTTTTTIATSTTLAAGPCETPVLPSLRVIPVNHAPASFAPFAKQPPGASDWYLVEQQGRILIVRNGEVIDPPFLDIEAAMGTSFGERGLLSVAFHPDYAQNGRFFTMGTPSDTGDGTYAPFNADAVVEWMRDPTNHDVALPTKVRDIVVLPASESNHNGGTIVFGPDGYLYVATGDGGGGCESAEPGAVQDTTTLFGKILRLDVDGAPPFAAPGNPFADDARVYHYGLRNPFRLNFDPVTNDLFIGDVGQVSFEEISVAPGNAPGQNFGWPAFEAAVPRTCGDKPLEGPSPHTPPIVTIDRRDGSTGPFSDYQAIIGGRVYRGTAIPALQGVYLFADFYGEALGALRYCGGEAHGPVPMPLSEIPTPDGTVSTISSFVEGNDGELYVTYGFSTRIGRIAPQ